MEETDNICFVCDQTIPLEKWKYQLQVTATKRRNAPVADLIQDLVGDEFEVLVGERDAICSKCMNLINLMDSLTFQLGEVRATLTQLLHTKYNLTEEDTQLQVEYDDSTREYKEPLHKCEICNYQTKYEKEFNMHMRTHPNKSKVSKIDDSSDEYSVSVPTKGNQKSKSKQSNKKSPKISPIKKKLPKKKNKTKKVPKDKKKKVVFQCGVCDQVFPDENEIRLHCKKDHGNDKIVVSDEDEYDDVQTLESSEEEIMLLEKTQKPKTTKRQKKDKTKLDFLDDWDEDEDNDDLHSPVKKPKVDESKHETVLTKIKNVFRSSLVESDAEDDNVEEKDPSSQPTCYFCKAKFSSVDAVQDHIKLSHGNKPNFSLSNVNLESNSATSTSLGSFEIDSTTDIAENGKLNTKNQKPKEKCYKCTFCGIKKVSRKFIKEHVKKHKRKLSLQCRKCGVIFKKVISLKVHAYKCHRVGSSLKNCRKCNFKFVSLVQLQNHIRKVHNKRYPKKTVNSRSKNDSISDKKSTNSNGELSVTKSKQNGPVKKSSIKTDNSNISVSEVSSTSIEADVKRGRGRKRKILPKSKYRCVECNVDFPQLNRFHTHRIRHTVNTCNTLGICVFCEKLFLSSEHLTIHTKTVHEKLYIKPLCNQCNKEYTLLKDLRLHHLRCHFNENAEKFVKQVSDHKNKDKLEENVENDVYNKVFKELQDLTGEGNDSEDMSAVGEKLSALIYNCPVCDFASQDDEELKSHLPTHVQHYCNICENILRPEEVINHLENHSIDFQGIKCSVCDRDCHDTIQLQSHTQISHPESKLSLPILKRNRFPCNMCEKSCLTEKNLLSHKASQHGEKTKKTLTCGQCKTDFFSEKAYENHIEFAHRSGLNCKYCDKSFDNIKRLIFHEKNHLKEVKRIIKCNICGKVLKSKQALKNHKSLHNSNNSTCKVCNKSFKSYHNLREHSAKHSSHQEKKFFCEICGKGFYFYDSHTRHRRVHLDPLLFQCKNCKERFQTKLKLIDHKKTCNRISTS